MKGKFVVVYHRNLYFRKKRQLLGWVTFGDETASKMASIIFQKAHCESTTVSAPSHTMTEKCAAEAFGMGLIVHGGCGVVFIQSNHPSMSHVVWCR